MEVNRLLGDEIIYELTIRGLPVLRTVVENRHTLRGALRAEREGIAPSPSSSIQLHPDQELATCEQKLTDLHGDIQNFDTPNRENEYRRISTRLFHIDKRLRRLAVEAPEHEERRKMLLGRVMQHLDSVGTLYDRLTGRDNPTVSFDQDPNREVSILDDPNPMLPESQPSLVSTHGIVSTAKSEDVDQPSTSFQGERPTSQANPLDEVNLIDLGEAPSNPGPDNRSLRRGTTTTLSADVSRPSVRFAEDVLSQRLPRSNLNSSPLQPSQPSLFRNPQYPPPLEEGLATFNTTQDFSERIRNLRLSPVTSSHRQYSEDHTHRFVDVSRWNLRYDGESSVTDFLERLEEMRNSRDISQERLLRSASELFKGQALLWFRMHHFQSWAELVSKLKEDFQPIGLAVQRLNHSATSPLRK